MPCFFVLLNLKNRGDVSSSRRSLVRQENQKIGMLGADVDDILRRGWIANAEAASGGLVERVTIWDANGLYPQIEVEATATYQRPDSEVK